MNGQKEKYLFGLFTLDSANVVTTALCAFKLDDLINKMYQSFKTDTNDGYTVRSQRRIQYYNKSFEKCDDYSNLKGKNLYNFVNEMLIEKKFELQETITNNALYYATNQEFTSMTVDSARDVLYLSSNNGTIFQITFDHININENFYDQPVIIHKFKTTFQESLKNLFFFENSIQQTSELILLDFNSLVKLNLNLCYRHNDCECSNDPYCAYNSLDKNCKYTMVNLSVIRNYKICETEEANVFYQPSKSNK